MVNIVPVENAPDSGPEPTQGPHFVRLKGRNFGQLDELCMWQSLSIVSETCCPAMVSKRQTDGIRIGRPERTSGAIDHSPFVYLRTPIRTRGQTTFRGIGRARARALPSQAPGVQGAAGFTQGNDPVL